MITLITGTPGAGKTLYAIDYARKHYKDRPLFVQGIPDLKIDHVVMPPEEDWTKRVQVPSAPEGTLRPEYQFPADSVLIIDECQAHFRPRASGSKIPDIEAALETHRHTGIDLLLITQHPTRISRGVATLVGRHLHIRRVWGLSRCVVYEWDHASSPDRINQATRTTWSYPKDVFQLYKSATVHTSRGQRPPALLYLVLSLIVAVPVAGYYFFQRIQDRGKPAVTAKPGAPGSPGAPGLAAPALPVINITQDFQPRIPGDLASAPAYDQSRMEQRLVMPRIISCISSATKCLCFTQQATPILPTPTDCRDRADGKVYDPYQPDQVQQASIIAPATRTPSANEGAGAMITPRMDKPS
ncbi:MAG: hypothetical protein HZB71_08880 [Betaproteobacteria bacterium]|nr:hypothetical protein [Betaproteobacteria bacterium]